MPEITLIATTWEQALWYEGPFYITGVSCRLPHITRETGHSVVRLVKYGMDNGVVR